MVNASRRYNNYKLICTGQQSPQIHEAKKSEFKGEVENSRVITGHINTLIMNRTAGQKITMEKEDLNNTTNQPDIKNIYRTPNKC